MYHCETAKCGMHKFVFLLLLLFSASTICQCKLIFKMFLHRIVLYSSNNKKKNHEEQEALNSDPKKKKKW